MRAAAIYLSLMLAGFLGLCAYGIYQWQKLPLVKEVPIWNTQPLPPLDYRTLSGGKVTRYFPSPETPNNPVQEATLEACRELPIKNATARSASVVIATKDYGRIPVSALVVGNTTLVSLGQVLRALRSGFMDQGEGTLGMFSFTGQTSEPSPGSIRLFPKERWAVIGSKYALVNNLAYGYVGGHKLALQQPAYWTSKGDTVVTLHDLLILFHESDVRRRDGQQLIQSAVVSYEPHSYRLYSPH